MAHYGQEYMTISMQTRRSSHFVSLMNRWSDIQHDVNLFCGCVSRIEARNHSGWTVDDKVITEIHDHELVIHFNL